MSIHEFIRRYDEALKNSGRSNRAASKAAGVSEDATRNPRRKGTTPDILAVIKLAHALEVSPFHFLEPLGITPEILQLDDADNIAHNEEERALLRLWRLTGDEERHSLMVLLGARMGGRTNTA